MFESILFTDIVTEFEQNLVFDFIRFMNNVTEFELDFVFESNQLIDNVTELENLKNLEQFQKDFI